MARPSAPNAAEQKNGPTGDERQTVKARKTCTCREPTQPPFRVVVFRRMQILVACGLFVMALAPLLIWWHYLPRECQRVAQSTRGEIERTLASALDRLDQLAESVARHPSALGFSAPASSSTPTTFKLGPVTVTCRRAVAIAKATPAQGFRLVDGNVVAFARVAAPATGVIIEAAQPLTDCLAALQKSGVELHLLSAADASGARCPKPIVWRRLHPWAAVTMPISDPSGRQIAELVALRPFSDQFGRALAETGLLAVIGLALFILFRIEVSARSRRVSQMWNGLTEALNAIAEGRFMDGSLRGACLESARAFMAVERLRARLQQQNRLLNNTSKLQNFLAHTYEEEKLAKAIWHYIRLLGVDAVEVFRIDSSRAHARRVYRGAAKGMPEAESHLQTPEDCVAYRQAAPFIVQDTHTELICETCVGAKDRSYYCIPLLGRGTTIGVLRLASRRRSFFTDQMQNTAETYAGMLATAMDNTYLFNELRQASLRDPLTGLHNRRFLEEYLAKRQAALDREQQPVGIIMLDLDHFKNFNDTYGHDAGDQALRAVGSVIQRHLRAGDVACRFGGEEIVVVAEGADAEKTAAIAERLRQAIEAEAIHQPQRIDPLRITASAGVAAYPEHATSLLETLRAADAALYEAKRQGRNRVVVYEPGIAGQRPADSLPHVA